MPFMHYVRNASRRSIRQTADSSDGFTLIELIVVIAILGILIAIAVPTIRGFLESSREQAYETDRRVIQLAVDAYYYSPGNERVDNKRQYPVMGKRNQNRPVDERGFSDTHTRLRLDKCEGSDADDPIVFTFEEKFYEQPAPPHPVLGTQGGIPIWQEGSGPNRDGVRNDATRDKTLLYCPPDPEEDTDDTDNDDPEDRTDHWLAVVTTPQGTACSPQSDTGCVVFSSRDYIIDFCELIWKGFLEDIPRSASNDHDRKCTLGSADPEADASSEQEHGSYTWYVDVGGKVQSLYFFLPTEDRVGYQIAYP